jgi:hypothetical protein
VTTQTDFENAAKTYATEFDSIYGTAGADLIEMKQRIADAFDRTTPNPG